MSTLLFENSHSDKALKYLEKALDLEPLNPEALTNYGNVLYDLKRPLEAIDAYRKALLIDNKNDDIYYNLGNA